VTCTDSSTATGTLTQQYDGIALAVTGSSKTYFFQTNWWSKFASETEPFNGIGFTMNNPQNAVSASNAPMGFPSIFIGSYAGHSTTDSNLPKAVTALTQVPTSYHTNNSTIGTSNHNAAYDVWFTQSSQPLAAGQSSPGQGGAYLMVWMFKPSDRQPRGSDSGRGNETIAGVPGTWEVWYDPTSPPCVSYVSTTPLEGLDFDLNDFIKHAVANSYGVTSSMYLSIVFGGFEVWGGSNGLQLTQFCADVQ
jgi:hypothetical protein